MKRISFGLLLMIQGVAYATPIDLYFQKLQAHKTIAAVTTAPEEKFYTQLIDHQNPTLGKFQQRYYLDETYSLNDASPVFFMMCPEATCQSAVLYTAIREYAQKYHAKLVALEHRYYGISQPFPTLSTENLHYLTYENALEDIVSFVNDMKAENHWSGKWISFGGSYAGTISAYLREKHPEIIAGSIASSAPVVPKLTFPEFDEHVTEVAGQQCADNMRSVVNDIESALSNDKQMTQYKNLFGASKVKDNLDFLNLVSEVGDGAIQYGYKDTFCGLLSQSHTPIEGYAYFAKLIYGIFGIDAIYLTPQGAESEDPATYEKLIGLRQWYYQTCSQFGGWLVPSNDPSKSTSSKYLDINYQMMVCKRLFNIDKKPDIEDLNTNYYLPLLTKASSNILFTNGAADPWSKMSLIDANGNTNNKNLSYFLIENGSHCTDLQPSDSNDSVSLKAARLETDNLINKWLS